MRKVSLIILACFALVACSKDDTAQVAGEPAAKPAGFGEVAFTTYQSDGFRIVFVSASKARKTWANMSGDAVNGQYTQVGKEIDVQWDPAASHHGSLSERFSQTGPCALARYERVDRNNQLHDADPQIYQRTKPLCDAVRLMQ